MSNEIPRRSRLDQNTPAELAIRAVVGAVEAMPADPRLTAAVVLLQAARDYVADFVDGIERARTGYAPLARREGAMSDTPRSAADKATEFLYLHNSLCRSQHLHHRAMLTDNCERGSAQKAATFDADDLSALMVDLREVEAKNDLLREANFALVADLSALQRETLKDGKRLTDARAENTALRVALEAETARAEYVRGLRDSLERELAEARAALADGNERELQVAHELCMEGLAVTEARQERDDARAEAARLRGRLTEASGAWSDVKAEYAAGHGLDGLAAPRLEAALEESR